MDERDIAHKYIDTLRTNLSRAWTAKDVAEAKVITEHNKIRNRGALEFQRVIIHLPSFPISGRNQFKYNSIFAAWAI
jgi:hypothetical protein